MVFVVHIAFWASFFFFIKDVQAENNVVTISSCIKFTRTSDANVVAVMMLPFYCLGAKLETVVIDFFIPLQTYEKEKEKDFSIDFKILRSLQKAFYHWKSTEIVF